MVFGPVLGALTATLLFPAAGPPTVTEPLTASVRVARPPTQVVTANGGVWAGVLRGGRRSQLVRIDPATNRVAARVHVEGSPWRLAAGGGSIWATANFRRRNDLLQRIDPRTNRVATIALPGRRVGPVAAGYGAAWVVVTGGRAGSGSLARVDFETNEATLVTPLEAGPPRDTFDELVLSGGAVWVLALEGLDDRGDLIGVDPESGRVTARVRARALNMGSGPGGLWITGCVDCDDYRESFFAQEIDTEAGVAAGPRTVLRNIGASPLFVGTRTVWLSGYRRGSETVVLRLDPVTRAVKRILRVGDFLHSGAAFDARHRAIWIARAAPPSVVRVRLRRP